VNVFEAAFFCWNSCESHGGKKTPVLDDEVWDDHDEGVGMPWCLSSACGEGEIRPDQVERTLRRTSSFGLTYDEAPRLGSPTRQQ
jgi:hypothetical protein